MITTRELTVDDYLAMIRRRLWVLLIPALLAPAVGFAISYLFAPKYSSTATVLVQSPKVPGDYVKPVVTEDLMQRIMTLQQQVLSRNRLQPLAERVVGSGAPGAVDDMIDAIRQNVSVQPVPDSFTAGNKPRKPGQSPQVPAFTVSFTYSRPRTAQQVCNQLTSMLIEENLKSREQVTQGTTDFLNRQVDQAKQSLDEQDSKLAAFKRQYVGQLPEDADSNLKVLMGLNSQLDAATQTINRAQQDKAYAESTLAQQLATWRASQSSTSPQALQQQLTSLQSQLVQLQARYTDDYPDVIKAKSDIAQVQKKLNEVTSAKPDASNSKLNVVEPAEIQQLRVQVHQYQQTIEQATGEQKRLQDAIKTYQGRVALSPAVEEQYKKLTRDYESAQKFYDDLLAKRSDSEMASDMERQQQGEQLELLNPASLPSDPSFPNRLLFAGGGFGGGLALGVALLIWLEFKDKAIRNELDVEAVMELPTLVSLPWLNDSEEASKRNTPSSRNKETVTV